ncbi:unnamed protein product [Symbiodinium microadriaticum]|nr:unnamed protein product [Symbiodinium microadriaticum]
MTYEPFQSVDGFSDRVCRGSNSTDSQDSYYAIYSPSQAPSLEACQSLCQSTPGCQGIEYRGWCEVWTRPGGIGAVAPSPGSQCLRYQPFVGVDGGVNRACRGVDASDSWGIYYTVYGQEEAATVEDCKSRCIATPGCKGIQFQPGRCEVWTRRAGIGTTAPSAGTICMRYGTWSASDASDAFVMVEAGPNQACRGSSPGDDQASYYILRGPDLAADEAECRQLCMATPECQGIDFSPDGCKVWTRKAGIQSSAAWGGATCLRYDPFEPVDGGEGRACHGDVNESSEDYVLYASADVPTLADCKIQCASTTGCKGVSFSIAGCQVWTRQGGITSTASAGSSCFRYMPFTPVNGGEDQACRGAHSQDNDPSHYLSFSREQVPSIELCRLQCAATEGCTGLEFGALGCKVWTRFEGVQATETVQGSNCLRFGPPNELVDASAFKPVDGGIDRACRGSNETDNLDAYYTLFWSWPENSSMEVRTPSCRGLEFRMGGCEIWTLAAGIGATVASPGRTCLAYKPFRTLDGFSGRVCRGSSPTDSLSSYYTLTGPDVTPTLDACQNLCMATPACKGVEYRNGWCEVWRRPEGIMAIAVSPGADCLRYEPFTEVDGGVNRACRGADVGDNWGSHYTILSESTLDGCKEACLSRWNCKGIEYRKGRCEVWTRPAGIQASVASAGAVCLRLGGSDDLTTDAFLSFQGSVNRACRGSDPSDDQLSYYDWHGSLAIQSLEQCKLKCLSTAACRGIDFSEEGCKVWTREVQSSVERAGSTCFLYEPFQPVDGGEDRDCRGAHSTDISPAYFTENPEASSLLDCKLQCVAAGCKGLAYNSTSQVCQIWATNVRASTAASGSICLRFEPFVDVNGGRDQSCRGGHVFDNSGFYYRSYTLAQVSTLESCRVQCVGTNGCKGIDWSASGCKVWLRVQGIEATAAEPGSICVRYGVPDPLRSADAFPGMDGGINRACRGVDESDNDPLNWIFFPISQVRTLEACQLRCIFKPGCFGVEFNLWGCEVWMREIQASVYASGYQCFRFTPFVSADGFNDRACRGQDASDNLGSYLTFYGRSGEGAAYDGQRSTCEQLCASTSGCKGIEFSSGHCEVWTREAGIQATAPALGSSCLRFEPFSNVEGGVDRACRGEDPFDNWPSYYTLTSASSVQDCKQLCMGTAGCHGIEYSSSGRCELWTRARGIGSSSAAVGYVCMRYGSWDPSDVLDGFLPADGAFDRACRGMNRTDMNPEYYVFYALDIAPTLGACKAICTVTPGCKGVEFSSFGCEVWTRAEGIEATAAVSGFQCYRYVAFEPVDGGLDRACRGADTSDAASANFVLCPPSEVASLEQCQARCVERPGCRGVSYSAEGCELWTRPFGIEATVPKVGSSCFRHEPFTDADGGKDRACRGAQPWDNSTEHYREATLPIPTLGACKVACVNSPGCKGIEFQPNGKCLIWTRPGGIDATATSFGSICLRHGATQAGASEEGSLVGQIHLASDPRLCLDVGGFNNGDAVQVGQCTSSTRFVMNSDDTAQIRLASDLTKCLDVAGGVKSNGTRIQIWDCETPVNGNMQFLFPDGGVGQIRWATYLDMCLQPMGNTTGSQVILWNCRRASGNSRVVLPSGELRTVRTPKFVAHYLPWFLGNNVDEACTRSGPNCPYAHDHWCSTYGNSYYASYLGAYDITGPNVIETQLDLMKASGLDGLWIDYQMPTWDGVVDRIVAGLKTRGMGFAIMVDSATFPDVMATTAEKVTNWTMEPHYYRHQGLPIIPVWNNNFTIFSPLPVNAIYITRYEFDPPEWASDTYTWVQDDYLVRYYEQHHAVVSSGSAFRGYRDCYFDKTLKDPNVTQLEITLNRARQHRPEYVQLVTWNDYTEGTQLEPSWIRREGECVDVCGENCLTVSDCHSNGLLTDCMKPVGAATGPADPSCNVTGNLSAFADLNQVAAFIARERYIGQVLAQAARYVP